MEQDPSSSEFNERYASPRDAALHQMCLAGWANMGNGFAGAPTGYFWAVSNSLEEIPEITDAFDGEFRACGLTRSHDLVGNFIVIERLNGQVEVESHESKDAVAAAYLERVTEFTRWLGYTT